MCSSDLVVTAASGKVPTGTVTITDGTLGVVVGTCSLSSGACDLPTNTLAVGGHALTALYAGDANFVPAASSALTQTTIPAPTTTSVTSSLNPSVFGRSVTVTVRVDATTGVPTGLVTVTDGTLGAIVGTCSLTTGSSCSVTTSALTAGTHAISAA